MVTRTSAAVDGRVGRVVGAVDTDSSDAPLVVRVLPDVAAIDKEFDYLVPPGVDVAVGDVVRIEIEKIGVLENPVVAEAL